MFVSVEKKVLSYCTEKQLFIPGEEVVLGVSGGADSVCLLFVLYRLRQELGIQLQVVHVNHLIREDAKADADYVAGLCEELQVPFYYVERDVSAIAQEQKRSEEEVGRQIRYAAFEEVARLVGSKVIAVAHHRNDRAETMLFQLFRGSGITGMASIREKRECPIGRVVRPLLCLSREEIEGYLQEQHIAFHTDSTNASDDYARNRIRHHILPYATDNICQATVEHLWNAAEVMGELEDYMMLQVAEAERRCVFPSFEAEKRCMIPSFEAEKGCVIPSAEAGEKKEYAIQLPLWKKEHKAIQNRLIYELLKKLSDSGKDITNTHVQDVRNLCLVEGNRRICLPQQMEAERSYEQVILRKKTPENMSVLHQSVLQQSKQHPAMSHPSKQQLAITKQTIEEGCRKNGIFRIALPADRSEQGEETTLDVEMQLLSDVDITKYPTEKECKWLDYAGLPEKIIFRHRENGDTIVICDREKEQHRKKIKDILINEKMPSRERDRLWLLTSEEEVLWILGGRISEKVKVTENSRNILVIRIVRKI